MISLAEAAMSVGAEVVYAPQHGARERGVIKAVGSQYIHVAYGNSTTAKATRPEDLEFLNRKET